jgi:hypothetical protein
MTGIAMTVGLALQRTNAEQHARAPATTPPTRSPAPRPLSNQFVLRRLQAKLRIGAVNDPLEREADAAADRVMRMAEPALSVASALPTLSRKCDACEDEEKTVQRDAGPTATMDGAEAPAMVHNVLTAPGTPLDRETNSFMSSHMGHDFGDVRVHTDASADASAKAVGAKAYTVGRDLVFAAGEYQPGDNMGRHLIAHELAHVVQQGGAGDGWLHRKECSANRECSPPDRCIQPDKGETGTTAASTWWSLTVNVDVETDSPTAATYMGKSGHANVRFSESNGKQYTYGFYPAKDLPDMNNWDVPGCVNHPDTAHDPCLDRTQTFVLTQKDYEAALAYAQSKCKESPGHYFGVKGNDSYTCATFTDEVAKAAGKSLPSSTKPPTKYLYTIPVPAVDNPTTLNNNMKAAGKGIGDTESDVLAAVKAAATTPLDRYPWQERARWIRILLTETWISDADVAAVEAICAATSATDLPKIKADALPLLDGMHFDAQKARVKKALGV